MSRQPSRKEMDKELAEGIAHRHMEYGKERYALERDILNAFTETRRDEKKRIANERRREATNAARLRA